MIEFSSYICSQRTPGNTNFVTTHQEIEKSKNREKKSENTKQILLCLFSATMLLNTYIVQHIILERGNKYITKHKDKKPYFFVELTVVIL